MTLHHFYRLLLVLTSGCLVSLYIISEIIPGEYFFSLGFYSLFVFLTMSVFVFRVAKKKIVHPDKSKFISFIISNMLLKMFVTVITVLLYFILMKPVTKYFIVPFLTIYIIFTIFETYFLLKIANEKQ